MLASVALAVILAAGGVTASLELQPVPPAPPPALIVTAAEARSEATVARAAARAAREHRMLELANGTFTFDRTLLLPSDLTLKLQSRATITGSIPGQSLLRVSAGDVIAGGSISNTSRADAFDIDFAQRATGVSIRRVHLGGRHTNSVYLGAAGIRDLVVESCHFTGVTYGVLLNPAAGDARGITVTKNTFNHLYGDAVEINDPTSATRHRVNDVRVTENTVTTMVGSGSNSGLALGFAGVRHFRVTGNRLVGVRNEGVHVEDHSSSGLIDHNAVISGGVGKRPAIAIYRTSSHIDIRNNTVSKFHGGGIAVLWDPLGSSQEVFIDSNSVEHVTGSGITISGDVGSGPFWVTGNHILSSGANGLVVAGSHSVSYVENNTIKASGLIGIDSIFVGTGHRYYSGNSVSASGHANYFGLPAVGTGG